MHGHILKQKSEIKLDYQDKMIQLVERLFSHRCDVPVRKVGESDENQRIWNSENRKYKMM